MVPSTFGGGCMVLIRISSISDLRIQGVICADHVIYDTRSSAELCHALNWRGRGVGNSLRSADARVTRYSR